MKMWEAKCSGCGKMTPADKCPQLMMTPLCKPCWTKKHSPPSGAASLDQLSGRASRLHRGGRRFNPVIKHSHKGDYDP